MSSIIGVGKDPAGEKFKGLLILASAGCEAPTLTRRHPKKDGSQLACHLFRSFSNAVRGCQESWPSLRDVYSRRKVTPAPSAKAPTAPGLA